MNEKNWRELIWIFGDDNEILPGMKVCNLGYERCEKGHFFGPAVRSHYLIHFVISGKGVFERGGKSYNIGKNEAFLIRPDELTYYRADEENPWNYMWLGVSGSIVDEMIRTALGDEIVFRVNNEILIEIENLYHGCLDKAELGYKIFAVLFKFLGDVQAKKGTDSVRQLDAVSSAVNFMENNYFRPIDVSTIASEMGISRSHFTTLFTSAMGVAPYNYLLKLRIAKAEKLLIERPSLTVTEVAYSVGFSGVERFSEMFKKYTGFSPLVYRKKKGENL